MIFMTQLLLLTPKPSSPKQRRRMARRRQARSPSVRRVQAKRSSRVGRPSNTDIRSSKPLL